MADEHQAAIRQRFCRLGLPPDPPTLSRFNLSTHPPTHALLFEYYSDRPQFHIASTCLQFYIIKYIEPNDNATAMHREVGAPGACQHACPLGRHSLASSVKVVMNRHAAAAAAVGTASQALAALRV